MKKISILLVMIMVAFAVNAQVAINKDGSAPDASSILHVKSNAGGQFLFYDSDATMRLQSYQSSDNYDGNAYIDFGNSNGGYHSVGRIGKFNGSANMGIFSDIGLYFDFTSGTTHRMTGSGLGLGTTLPSEMLDVVGNATVSGDINAGGDITANGDLWGTNGYITDNLEVGGTGDFGNIVNISSSSGAGLYVTGTYHGGIDLISTNSGNTYRLTSASNGNFYIHGSGGATSSSLVISPAGNVSTVGSLTSGTTVNAGTNINVGTEVNRTAQGSADLIPIAYGTVLYDGTILNSGTGNWTVTETSTGRYEVEISGETYSSDSYMTQITPRYISTNTTSNGVRIGHIGDTSPAGKIRIYMKDGDGDFQHTSFHFIVYKQ